MKMKSINMLLLVFLCTACTYSVSVIHTEGEANDVFDQGQDANPNFDIPLTKGLV